MPLWAQFLGTFALGCTGFTIGWRLVCNALEQDARKDMWEQFSDRPRTIRSGGSLAGTSPDRLRAAGGLYSNDAVRPHAKGNDR